MILIRNHYFTVIYNSKLNYKDNSNHICELPPPKRWWLPSSTCQS